MHPSPAVAKPLLRSDDLGRRPNDYVIDVNIIGLFHGKCNRARDGIRRDRLLDVEKVSRLLHDADICASQSCFTQLKGVRPSTEFANLAQWLSKNAQVPIGRTFECSWQSRASAAFLLRRDHLASTTPRSPGE